MPTTVPSTSTLKSCWDVLDVAALGGVEGEHVGAGRPVADGWLNEPVSWRKATCDPSGAGGLPEVKPLLLPEMPALPVKVQGEPVGSYWNWPAPTCTCSNPGSSRAQQPDTSSSSAVAT